MATEVTPEAIAELATAPQSISTDGLSVSERPIQDVIAADQYAVAKSLGAGTNPNGGPRSGWGLVRAARFIPGGS
jgi:hypothetical protein